MTDLILVVHNVRSAQNVGSLIRTCEGLSTKLVLCGYTPYPMEKGDKRLPHVIRKVDARIKKTSLGAEASLKISRSEDIKEVTQALKQNGFRVVALEQTGTSIPITEFKPGPKVALIVGNEVDGLDKTVLELCDSAVEIPMLGEKESYNVAQAAAMALFYLRFMS